MDALNVVLLGLVFAAVTCGGAVVGLFATKRFIPIKESHRSHEVAGPFLSVMGTLYAILMGFLIADAIGRYIQAQAAVETEAASLAAVFRLARALPQEQRDIVRDESLKYASIVIEQEWPLMAKKKYDPKAWGPIDLIWKTVLEFKPGDARESNIQMGLIDSMNETCKARRNRILFSASGGLAPLLWTVLIAGGIAIITCAYLFELEARHVHVVAVILLAAVISLNFFLLLEYSYPFDGQLLIRSTPFQQDRHDFQFYLAHPDH